MTLFVDTSALVKRYVSEEGRELVVAEMAADPVWCASAIARTETAGGNVIRQGVGKRDITRAAPAFDIRFPFCHGDNNYIDQD